MNNKLIFMGTIQGVKDSTFTNKETGITTKSRKFKFILENDEDIQLQEFKIEAENDNLEAGRGSKVQFEVSVSSFENKLYYKAISKIQLSK